jgi:uncharacterized circularly permuted ATP-grasp superfamily protein
MTMEGRDVAGSPIEVWHGLLRQEEELSPAFWERLSGELRARKLTFGGRISCPFLRPLFLLPGELDRVRAVAQTVARLGERVVAAALEHPALLEELALTGDEKALVMIEPGYARASTASRLDAFLLPEALWFAEYNAESPAGFGYTEALSEVFDALPVMGRFRERFHTRRFRMTGAMLDALLESYREWGGTADPPTVVITDWREVPTWNEFEILRERFEALGVPTVLADPRELEFDGRRLAAGGRTIDLVYRRVLISDMLSRRDESAALVDAYRAGAVCVANTFRCKIAHKKAFFAVLTDPRFETLFTPGERRVIDGHVPWTRVLRESKTTEAAGGRQVDLVEYVRRHRDELVIKPNDEYGGAGVSLGWEATSSEWDAVVGRALADGEGAWVAQRRIPVRREIFPMVEEPHRVAMRDMLVDFAPYLFLGKVAGFLTRLSSTGLANVTAGGGQVPSFLVEPK